MGDYQTNYDALIAAVRNTSALFGLTNQSPQLGTDTSQPLERIWVTTRPPDFVRPATAGAFYDLPRNPAQAIRTNCAVSFSLTLDSEWTSPHVRVGVKLGAAPNSRTDCIIMVPGDTITVTTGFTCFWVFAVDGSDLFGVTFAPGVQNSGLVGYVSFIVGHAIGTKPEQKQTHPQARIIAAGCYAPLAQIAFPCCQFLAPEKCKKIRVLIYPLAEAGTIAHGEYNASVSLTKIVRPGMVSANMNGTNNPYQQEAAYVTNTVLGLPFPPLPAARVFSSYDLVHDAALGNANPGVVYFPVEPTFVYQLRTPMINGSAPDGGGDVTGSMYIVEACDEYSTVDMPKNVLLYELQEIEGMEINTGDGYRAINTNGFDAIGIQLDFAPATQAALAVDIYDVNPTLGDQLIFANTVQAAKTWATMAIGMGAFISINNFTTALSMAMPVPKQIKIVIASQGNVTSHLRVRGIRTPVIG